MDEYRLHLSSKDKKLGGVCGGVAEYFDFDPTIVRVFFLFFAFVGGGGLLLYLIIWLVAPKEDTL